MHGGGCARSGGCTGTSGCTSSAGGIGQGWMEVVVLCSSCEGSTFSVRLYTAPAGTGLHRHKHKVVLNVLQLVAPSFSYPAGQSPQVTNPIVFVHLRLLSQPPLSAAHLFSPGATFHHKVVVRIRVIIIL